MRLCLSMLILNQIWSSLGLEATSVAIHPSDDNVISWTFRLDYCQQKKQPSRKSLHKIASDVPYYDVKPPAGVEVVTLRGIHLKMMLAQQF